MALVVLLRGVNVGGHRTFRPAALAQELQHLGAVNIGAAGTFVIPRPISQTSLRAELARRLPFETDVVIVQGHGIVRLLSSDHFTGQPSGAEIVRFVSVLARTPRLNPTTPISFPERGPWLLKLVARDGRFVIGMYRRHMKAIGYLGAVDRLFGVPATTRNWNTLTAIVKALNPPRSA